MRFRGVFIAATSLSCISGCESLRMGTDLLDTGDVLTVSTEQGLIYTSEAPASNDCSDGAKVQLLAHRADGAAAGNAKVQVWITGATAATLSTASVELDDDGTSDAVCLHPGIRPGDLTLHARSGPIETMTTVQIQGRKVPPGGKLVLSISPPSQAAPPPASACGIPATTCPSGASRAADVSVHGMTPVGDEAPEGTNVTLNSSIGWFGVAGCPDQRSTGVLSLALTGGAAHAKLCLSEQGGTATLTARSGTVENSATIEVRTIPRSVFLVPSRLQATAGTAISFVAFVTDCGGQPVADVPLALQTRSGTWTPAEGTPAVPRTGADGSVTLSGIANVVPLTVDIQILGASQVHCEAGVGEVQ